MPEFEISTILKSFSPISLAEMDGVAFMNRVESKYVFSSERLPVLLDLLSENYKILEIENTREFSYHTTYLDTPGFFLLNQQLRGKLNRYKVRYRRYEASGLTFLEIKKKTNKLRTVKWRIENRLNGTFDNAASVFLKDNFPYNFGELKPILINEFKRITLVGKVSKERITVDSNIQFSIPDGIKTGVPSLAIAEIKSERHSICSPICNIMKTFGIPPQNFSKCSVGNSLVRDLPRKNSLKPNLLLINKLENERIKSA